MNTPLQDLLRAAGLARVSTAIEQVTLPSIRLRAHTVDETLLKPGTTRFGGSPDVSPKWVWPEYNGSAIPFVGQISLAEIVSCIPESGLPSSGMLSFFFHVDAFFETWPRDPATWRVQYDPFALQRSTIPEMLSKGRAYHFCALTCSLEWTLPDYSQYDATSLQRLSLSQPLTDEEEEAYYHVQAQLAGRVGARYHTPLHRLLGHPDDVQWDMHGDLPGSPTEWQLLLQVDSDGIPNTEWGDTGRIYYWIRTQDLARRDFSQAMLLLQST